MHSHGWVRACALASLFAMYAATSFAESSKIGNATATKNHVQGVLDGNIQDISKGSDVFTNEVVRTGDASVADLLFVDKSTISVGPTSEVRLDKFVYDPGGSSGAVVIQATRGAFRFVTGTQDKKNYQIKTPFGTLGIRG
jgi:hypothetical protein